MGREGTRTGPVQIRAARLLDRRRGQPVYRRGRRKRGPPEVPPSLTGTESGTRIDHSVCMPDKGAHTHGELSEAIKRFQYSRLPDLETSCDPPATCINVRRNLYPSESRRKTCTDRGTLP